VDALKALHRREGTLFGQESRIVKNKQIGGQGKFFIRVQTENIQCKSIADLNQDALYKLDSPEWQSYLLGLGIMEYDRNSRSNKYHRSAIISGNFSVELYFRDKDAIDELKSVLLVWGMLGGLGSRNRKGMGSVNIVSLDGESIPYDRETYIKYLKQIIQPNSFRNELPPYTAFSKKVKVLISPEKYHSTWEALGSVGETMQKFRGWGYKKKDGNHLIKGKIRASHNDLSYKQSDHDLIYTIANNSNPPNSYPNSIAFGLPKLYKLTHCGTEYNQTKEIKIEPAARDSTGQPDKNNTMYFIRIDRTQSNCYI
jgi:CRISPR-associated protein Cmr1